MSVHTKTIKAGPERAQPADPNFLYIGAEKAGSSWIYEILREHPQVYVPPAKDIQFFDKKFDKGIEWYLSLFSPGAGYTAIGEVSHDYFLAKETAELIYNYLPRVRLICCLREPIDRTISSYLYYRTTVLHKTTTLEEFAFEERILKLSDYYYNLRPFYESFPRKNIQILFFDDLKQNPDSFARRIFEFLNVDPDFRPKVLHRKILPASEPRLSWLTHFAYQIGLSFRRLGWVNVVGSVKRTGTFRRLLYKELAKRPQVSPEFEEKLRTYYASRYERLPELIGMPLPDGWNFSPYSNPERTE